ncbi:MAG: DedA family protein [Alloprevotella sp.]|nr:DedA family protein [Alloprevotella sp.]
MMASLQEFFISIGPAGMFLSAFLAGSVLPFSSELVMVGLLAAGTNSLSLLCWGTLGNFSGAVVNYKIGSLGNIEQIKRWTKVSPEKLDKGLGYVRRYGPWAGLLAWVPILGSVITVSLGFLHTRFDLTMLNIFVGKLLRYSIIIALYEGIF